jgi:uncharacterized protein
VGWHGCEPLSLPISFYEEAFSTFRVYSSTPLEHVFQTNATLITDDWIRFFKKYEIGIGVSVDGPSRFHDHSRKYRSGSGSFARAMHGVHLLCQNRIPFHCICVLTELSVHHPKELFEFFSGIGATSISFAPEEPLGLNQKSSLTEREENVAEFWRVYLALLQELPHGPTIDEFVDPLAKAQADPAGISSLTQPGNYVTVDVDGYLSTFSPEFLTWTGEKRDSYLFGHVSDPACLKFELNPNFRRVHRAISRGVKRCRDTCSFFAFCGGGSPAAKAYENHTCDSTETFACRTRIKLAVNAVRKHIEHAT